MRLIALVIIAAVMTIALGAAVSRAGAFEGVEASTAIIVVLLIAAFGLRWWTRR